MIQCLRQEGNVEACPVCKRCLVTKGDLFPDLLLVLYVLLICRKPIRNEVSEMKPNERQMPKVSSIY
jgi:hypothetical protein